MPEKQPVASESGRVLQLNTVKLRFSPAEEQSELQTQLKQLAEEIASGLSTLEASQSKELLGGFVSDLYCSLAEQERREVRSQKQTERIAAARKRGVRFGRQRLPVPEGFEDMAQLWEEGGISAGNAAAELGMSRDTFLRRAKEHRAAM